METFELRYFQAVAQTENIHRAAEKLRVSPGSLSKAIARLEDELGVRLFSRVGRNIRLTEQGHFLRLRTAELLSLEEATRAEIMGRTGKLHAVIAGPEVLLSYFGIGITEKIRKSHPESLIEYQACSDSQSIERVQKGDAQLGIISSEFPRELTGKLLGEVDFKTTIGRDHTLYRRARSGQAIPVTEVLKHGFACPNGPWLGAVGPHQSFDGWRDDQFPRKVHHQTSSLKLIERIVASGMAIAYLPDYLITESTFTVLKITGCPYHCTQTIRLIARRPKKVGWINALFTPVNITS